MKFASAKNVENYRRSDVVLRLSWFWRQPRRCARAAIFIARVVLTVVIGLGVGTFASAEAGTNLPGDAPSVPTVILKEIIVDPSNILSTDEVEELVRRYLDRELTLDELYDIVEEFNALYEEKGYLAAALLPEQFIDDGVVRVQLAEGRIGNVVILGNRHTTSNFVDKRLDMASGDLVALDRIEAGLIAFNDTYDVQLHAELQVGQAFGTTDVVVHVLEPANNEYTLWTDSGGRDEFGLGRYGFTWVNRSLFGHRDALTLSWVSGQASRSGTLTYGLPVSRRGTRLGVTHTYSYVDVISGEFRDVGIAGDSIGTGVTMDVPFRSQQGDVYHLSATYNGIDSNTYFDGYKLTGYTLATWRLGTSAQFVRQGGTNHWGYGYNYVAGQDSIQQKPFAKHTLAGSFQRLFRNGTVLAVTVSGQMTDSQLLPESEQFMLGGMSTIRGYESGQLAGDEGYLVNVEWTGTWTPWLRWTLYVDHGHVVPYKGNLEPIGPDDYVTSGAIGFHVQMTEYLRAQILSGTPLDKGGDGVFYFRVQADF